MSNTSETVHVQLALSLLKVVQMVPYASDPQLTSYAPTQEALSDDAV